MGHRLKALRQLSVLVVDDDIYMARLMAALLEAFEFTHVEVALNPVEASKIIAKGQVDCVVMDQFDTEHQKSDLLEWIRTSKENKNPDIPVIMCTGRTHYNEIVCLRDAGATEIVAKPISPNLLLLKIIKALFMKREFVAVSSYTGPDRRRHDVAYEGPDRRGTYGLDQGQIDQLMDEGIYGVNQVSRGSHI